MASTSSGSGRCQAQPLVGNQVMEFRATWANGDIDLAPGSTLVQVVWLAAWRQQTITGTSVDLHLW